MGFHAGAATKTYTNEAQEEFQVLGIEQFLIAPESTAFTATASGPTSRVSIASPPSGFLPLGAVVDDSVSVTYDRAKAELRGGVLSVLQKEWVNQIDAKATFALRDVRGQKLLYMLGNGQITNIYGTTYGTDAATVSSVTSRKVLTLRATSIASVVVGNHLVFSTVASLVKTYNEGVISAITDDGSFTTVTLVDSLETTVVANESAAKLFGEHVYAGTAINKYYTLLGVADTVDGVQIQHFFPKVAPAGTWTSELRRDAPVTLPMEFNVLPQTDSAVSDEYVAIRITTVRSW